MAETCDLAIVGGGLAGSLIALALQREKPLLDVRLIEAGSVLGGNHLWSFFASDVAPEDRWLVEPLIVHRWPEYAVRFPAHERTIAEAYHSIESQRLDAYVRATLPPHRLKLGLPVADVSANAVTFADGTRLEASGVIDTRGAGDLGLLDAGWQKFVGRVLDVAQPHGLAAPIVMDATVAQIDGYRFVYVLPFSPTRVFVEDTYYSDTPNLAVAVIEQRIADYAAAQGWSVTAVVHQETGVLPVTIGGDFERYWASGGAGVAKAGVRAGLFHPTTGYSLPDAVRTAALISRADDLSGAALHDLTFRHARAAWHARGFYRMLDAMLFRAAAPAERYKVLERFYMLAPRLIGRFYAGRSTMIDKARVLIGKPPVPIARALAAIGARR